MSRFACHASSIIESDVSIGENTIIWQNSIVRKNAKIGQNAMIGRNVFIDHDVLIGDLVRIQNNSLIYFPTVIAPEVFIGPGVIIANDKYPRVSPISTKPSAITKFKDNQVSIMQGASIGAGVICVGPAIIREWSMIGAGSILIGDTVAFGLYVGSPAKRVGWVGHEGHTLKQNGKQGNFQCARSGRIYKEVEKNKLVEVL